MLPMAPAKISEKHRSLRLLPLFLSGEGHTIQFLNQKNTEKAEQKLSEDTAKLIANAIPLFSVK